MYGHLAPLVAAVLLLASCTTWVKPGATELDRDRDSNACELQSYNNYPPRLRQILVEPAHWDPPTEECHTDKKGRQRCVRTGGGWQPARYGTADENDAPRRTAFEACMYKYGWQKE